MNNLKLFPSYTIPGFLVLSGFLSIFFECSEISLQRVVLYLMEHDKLLVYFSIAAIAVSYIIGSSTNRLIVRLVKGKEAENQSFRKWIPILQHGSQSINAELTNIYAGMMLYRLLTGAILFAGICFSIWFHPKFFYLILLVSLILGVLFLIIYKLTLSSFKNFEDRCLHEISNREMSE